MVVRRLETVLGDQETAEVEFGLEEFAFRELYVELVVRESFEDFLDVLEVLFLGFAEDEDVVKVDNDVGIVEIAEYSINHLLEGGRSIGESKRHDVILKVSNFGSGCCFVSISESNKDIVVAVA